MSARAAHRSNARALARRLALQALYRWQLNDCPWQDLLQEFAPEAQTLRADREYLGTLLAGICSEHQLLDEALAPLLDRKPAELDPIEHAALLIGSYELKHQPEIPVRVILNEAVGLARRFGATDGYKFVNGVLDRAARTWRAVEMQ